MILSLLKFFFVQLITFIRKNNYPILIFFLGIVLTFVLFFRTKIKDTEIIRQNFEYDCNDVNIKIESRLSAHAQLIRSGAAYFMASDSVTREEWNKFNLFERIDKNLPGIQCVGYAQLLMPENLVAHINKIRENGFPNYSVRPYEDRDIYTSIVYIAPFSGANLKAFGFDMFSEPIRHKAMELSRDSDLAMLSGKVYLIQEMDTNKQPGTLMYVPVYKENAPISTIEQRRAAIKGWVYSAYRMHDLMINLLGNWETPNKNKVRLRIYDEKVSYENLLYDNRDIDTLHWEDKSDLCLILPMEYHGKKWILQFNTKSVDLYMLKWKTGFILFSGFIISGLLSALLMALLNSKKREKHIQLLNNQLEKYNSDKDRFISILAHDLKSPFSALQGFIDLLYFHHHEYSAEKIYSFIGNIRGSIIYTSQLLDDILLWARAQSGKMPFNPEVYDISLICKDVIDGLKLNAEVKNIHIQNRINIPVSVVVDKNMIHTVLRNLLSNAIKFTKNGGGVEIFLEQNKDEIKITVADNGIGIEPEMVDQLFHQLHIYTTVGTDNEKGTGFGLILCKEFINKHEGKIWVTSQLGVGSNFSFTLKK